MKVLQINATYGFGSTGKMVKDIDKALSRFGHESYVFCSQKPLEESGNNVQIIGNLFDHNLHGIMWRLFHNQGWNSRLATLSLCKKIDTLKPDVIHFHNLHSNYIHIGILLKHLGRKKYPLVITLHDCWFFTGNCYHFIPYGNCDQWKDECISCTAYKSKMAKIHVKNQFFKKRTLLNNIHQLAIVGVSDWISSCADDSSILRNADITRRIYNWIDCETFKLYENSESIKKKYGVDSNKKLILGVSQGWAENKGLREMYQIANKLGDAVQIILVGNSCGNSDTENVRFIGYTSSAEELAMLYSAADVFVNPSKMETFGKVTAEAMACGTPIVAYSNTGTSELVSKDVGIIVEDGNIPQLIQAVCSVLESEKKKYSENCRQRACNMFNMEAQTRKYIDLYEEIIKIDQCDNGEKLYAQN